MCANVLIFILHVLGHYKKKRILEKVLIFESSYVISRRAGEKE
jgi:hypothetical protein